MHLHVDVSEVFTLFDITSPAVHIIHWGHIVSTMMYGYMFYIKNNYVGCDTSLQINIDGDHSCLCT